MMSSVRPAAAVPRAGGAPGVTVAVLRRVMDLMQVQGDAVVTMIHSAPGIRAPTGSVTASASAVADPLVARQVDLLA